MQKLTPFSLKELHDQHWFSCLSPWQAKLVDISINLFNRELTHKVKMEDYSFVVFSMSKAYEGFLKKFFYQLGLIDKETYEGKKFRIGRAFNPDVSPRYRDRWWLYDDVSKTCGEEQSRWMWNTWLLCRNRVFHFFPREHGMLDLQQVQSKLNRLIRAMDMASTCMKEDKRCNEDE